MARNNRKQYRLLLSKLTHACSLNYKQTDRAYERIPQRLILPGETQLEANRCLFLAIQSFVLQSLEE